MNQILRGDIYYADLGPATEPGVQSGERPVLIISNDMCNKHSPVIHVMPLTTRISKQKLPTQTQVTGSIKLSLALGEQITLLPKTKLQRRIGKVNNMYDVDICIKVQFGL